MKKKAAKAEALTEEQLDELRGALEAEKDSIDEELASHGKKTTDGWTGSSESVGEEADPVDAADNIEELAINIPLVGELDVRRKDIAAALLKMDGGKYGVCEECGKPIDFDRLEANPAARTCIEHA